MRVSTLVLPALATCVALSGMAAARGQGAGWLPTAGPWTQVVLDDDVRAATVFDDGDGAELYIGGLFSGNVARLVDGRWSPVGAGPGPDYSVLAFAAFDDGSGEALYAGGSIPSSTVVHLMRWDGTSWSQVPGTFEPTGGAASVKALAVFDDGSGPALYAGGRFTTVGSVPATYVAKWDGTSWSSVGVAPNGSVNALHVHDDGTGAALYAAGDFNAAGGMVAPRVARWNGTTWTPVGGGVNGEAHALASIASGPAAGLYVGGVFTHAEGQPASRVARWDGTTWSALGAGVDDRVDALSVFDDGNGDELFLGGRFDLAGGALAGGVARWNGTAWSALPDAPGGGPTRTFAFAELDDGTGAGMFVCGAERGFDGVAAGYASRWRDGAWAPPTPELDGFVDDVTTFEDDAGTALCVVGGFRYAGGVPANGVVRWDGRSWSPLGDGFHSWVRAAESFQGDLFAAGDFLESMGDVANGVARWDGTAWTKLGSGAGLDWRATSLGTFDDGSGLALYVGGSFGQVDGTPVDNVARWDGTAWSTAGRGLDARDVYDFVEFDDGTGSTLYAGVFTWGSGHRVARLDGTSWSYVGADFGVVVRSLAVFDPGTGPRLYAGSSTVFEWDGSAWSTTGFPTDGYVPALGVFDDGTGEALYAYGRLDGGATRTIRRFDGTSWTTLGELIDRDVAVMFALEDAAVGGPALVVGGSFPNVVGESDAALTRWGREVTLPESFCAGDGSGAACPCGNVGAEGHGCGTPQGGAGIRMRAQAWHPDFAGGGTVEFLGTGFPVATTPTSQLIRSAAPQAPATVFGDGLLCVAPASLVRLSATLASNGVSVNPAMHGAGAGTYYYQLWVRSFPVMFCDPQAAFNLSNGVELTWP